MKTLLLATSFLILNVAPNSIENKDSVVFIISNQFTYGNSNIPTSNHFAEIVHAYDVFTKNGLTVDFVSPKGGIAPIGYLDLTDDIQLQYLYDCELMGKLKNTKKASEVSPSNYEAIYFSGGGAAMYGVPENKEIQKLASHIYKNNGIISAVCHGTAGLVNIKDSTNKNIIQGKKICGFPDLFEDMKKEYYKNFPFSIEKTINQNGGEFLYSKEGWDSYVIQDGRFVTGQDPSSTYKVANQVLTLIKKNNE